MKNVASKFSEEALLALRRELSIDLSDEKDYSADDLEDLYDQIVSDFPYEYDKDGSPLELGKLFEEIVDVFTLPGGLVQLNK